MNQHNQYLGTIKKHYPNLLITKSSLNTKIGQYNDILCINGELIFRFPKYKSVAADLSNEVRTLEIIKNKISCSIPDPMYSNLVDEHEAFMGYPMIQGVPFTKSIQEQIYNDDLQRSVAKQISGILRELHSISTEEIGLLPAPKDQILHYYELMLEKTIKELFPFISFEKQKYIKKRFNEFLFTDHFANYIPVLTHGDFGGSNLIYDREQERISGIIDFSFSKIGDAAYDLASISTLRPPYNSEIIEAYPITQNMLFRMKFYKDTFALSEALHGIENGDKDAFKAGIEAL